MYRCRSCDAILHQPRCVCGTAHAILGDGRMDAPGGDPGLNPPEQMTLLEQLEASIVRPTCQCPHGDRRLCSYPDEPCDEQPKPKTEDPGFRHLTLVKEGPL